MEITRQIKGEEFKLIHEEIQFINGSRYSNSFWRRIELSDNPEENTLTLLCKIPDGYDTMMLKYLSDECFEGNEPVYLDGGRIDRV